MTSRSKLTASWEWPVLVLLVVLSCAPKVPVEAAVPPETGVAAGADAGVFDPALRSLLRNHWEATMVASPVWATALGDHRYDDRLGDASAAQVARMRALHADFAAEARALPSEALSPGDRVTRDLFVGELDDSVRAGACRGELWSVSPRDNLLGDVNYLAELHQRATEHDVRNLLARYRAVPAVADALVANLREGLRAGLVANETSVRRVVEMMDTQLAQPIDSWPLLARSATQAEGIATLEAELRAAVADDVAPALQRYRDVLANEILPAARGDGAPGLASLPDAAMSDACYAALIQLHTTLPLAPATLHATGLEELARIHAELRTLGGRVLGTDDLQVIFSRLRDDPALRFATAEEVNARAEAALAAARAAIPRFFGRLPVAACEVKRVPDYEAPYTTIAYYRQPAPDGSRPGTYYVNTWKPESRPRFEAEVLAFHESIPGHHLQIALAQEQLDLPAFRRHGGATAFVEGWALYTERLADEMGLYSGDLDRLGVLSFDAWRAARLVVDTGLHDQGWSRQQALDFFRDNTPLALNNIDNEVDRYITTPGQALAYKTGQREILALRREAEAALGERFDLPAFHDVVLGGGAVSLPVLRARVEAWVSSRQ